MRTLALAGLIWLSLSGVGAADSSRIGGNYAQRGLTVPARTLRIDAGPRLPMQPYAPMRAGTVAVDSTDVPGDRQTALQLNLGFAAGVTENLDLGVLAVPLLVSPDMRYGDPLLYANYRLTQGVLEAGVFVAVDLPVDDHVDLAGGIPLIMHVGSSARVDLAALLHVRFGAGSPLDLLFPFELAFNISSSVFLGPETGITIADFDSVAVPLGFFVGYTAGSLGDLRGEVRLPNISDTFDRFQLLLRADLYFDL